MNKSTMLLIDLCIAVVLSLPSYQQKAKKESISSLESEETCVTKVALNSPLPENTIVLME